jgi:4-oxalocrotonate tautomerase
MLLSYKVIEPIRPGKCVEIINKLRIQLTVMPVIQITISQGRSVDQKRELVTVLTRETARIMKTEQEKVRILIYEVTKENWGNAGILGLDMK